MEQEVMQRRTFIFQLLYNRVTGSYSRLVPWPARILIEALVLFAALAVLYLWVYVHHVYITNPSDCLEQVTMRPFPFDTILQVEVFSNSTELWEEREDAARRLYATITRDSLIGAAADDKANEVHPVDYTGDEWSDDRPNGSLSQTLLGGLDSVLSLLGLTLFDATSQPAHMEDQEEGSHTEDVETDQAVPDGLVPSGDSDYNHSREVSDSGTEGVAHGTEPSGRLSFFGIFGSQNYEPIDSQAWERNESLAVGKEKVNSRSGDKFGKYKSGDTYEMFLESATLYEILGVHDLSMLSFDYTMLEFSQEPGFLSLSQTTRTRLNISVAKVYVDPDNSTCFGGPFGQFLTKFFLGYDVMIIASFKNLLPSGHASGYVRSVIHGDHYYYRVQWMGKWRYGIGMLPVLFFTLVASVLLRQIHYHVFKFLTHFQHLLNQGVPMPVQTGAQLPFLIITYAAIGLIIVMSEALGDDSIFSVLMVATVWEADQFYAVFCTKEASKKFFPMFFYLYHFLPYAYYVRFNGQFWFIPFLFHWIMVQFTMLFFLHRFELPSRPHQVLHLPEPQRIHLQGPRHLLVAQIPQIPEELPVEERVGEGVDIPHLPIAEDVEALPDDGGGEGGGVREEPEVEPVREVLNVEGERLVRSEFVTGNTSEQPTPRVNVYVTDREEAPGHYHPPRDRSRVTWLHRVDPDRAGGTLLGIGQRTVAGTHERLMPRSHLVRRTINITQTRQNASSSDNASQ